MIDLAAAAGTDSARHPGDDREHVSGFVPRPIFSLHGPQERLTIPA